MHTLVKIIISVAFTFTAAITTPETKTNSLLDTTIIIEVKNDTLISCEQKCKISSIEMPINYNIKKLLEN